MSDLKVFRLDGDRAAEIEGQSVAVEKSIQQLIEKHLDTFLGVRFLASEYPTGKKHGGRIDTLGIDENDCPVIVEYKRALNENVINQGLYYLDWLMDHKAEFQLLVMEKLGKQQTQPSKGQKKPSGWRGGTGPQSTASIEWNGPRLLCIAGDFTKYDLHAVQQMGRNIELIRYRRYGEDLLLFERLNDASGSSEAGKAPKPPVTGGREGQTFSDLLERSDSHLRDLYESLRAFLLSLGDVTEKILRCYVAYARMKNFACVEVHPQNRELLVHVRVNPDTIQLKEGFLRDMRGVGHYGTGDLQIHIRSEADMEAAKPHMLKSYEAS
jgi:predicted transport protein